ncbi:polysaccharide deacetylase family protein [Aliikangiella sp. IMCC44653]
MRKLKLVIYYIAKYTGLFALAKSKTKNKLRILCYHGTSFHQEHKTFDWLFIRPTLLKQRLETIKKYQLNVVGLDQAVDMLEQNKIEDYATVITFDDGWSGMYNHAAPILKSFNFPWTLYVSSYYMQKQTMVFNIVLQHLIRNGNKQTVTLNEPFCGLQGEFDLTGPVIQTAFYKGIIQYADAHLSATQKQALLPQLDQLLDSDLSELIQHDCYRYITTEQCKALFNDGVDIQLHTHRHIFPPSDYATARKELLENKEILDEITQTDTRHFCYPSGVYGETSFKVLKEFNIRSATNCMPGLNDSSTPKLMLRRFLDGENIKQIEFEAELSGFAEYFRIFLNKELS